MHLNYKHLKRNKMNTGKNWNKSKINKEKNKNHKKQG